MSNKTGRNAPCPCGSGAKYKKCCIGKTEVRGTFDPDLPMASGAGQVGNHLGSDGAWYVIRAGHGHGPTPKLVGERLSRARAMIAQWRADRLDAAIAARGGRSNMGLTLAAALAWGAVR